MPLPWYSCRPQGPSLSARGPRYRRMNFREGHPRVDVSGDRPPPRLQATGCERFHMLLELYHLCPWSHLVAILAKDSETSRLTNEGTAWPRQVPSVSLTRAAYPTALQPVTRSNYSSGSLLGTSCLCSTVVFFNCCWLLRARSFQKPCARSGKRRRKNITNGVKVDQEL